ncbi:hypothetical protein AWC05_12315 [Mycobacterium florentinum]|uniref:Uncharacterized protein n=1 Tax=Mycobacterium florentinum TaxID=292462 RepID=A0A1X1UGJ2_MYCFL|nr:hypothetical protein [Mycobacterium florentinum]MCV7412913.1 hypothetical protein [Mycobacterium florentinum]ORV55943.1 hypothetical protein AWC05_12315 [Mycobacterium florentinum]BBX76426.1 hypothetical protein MFLOJ_02130 [Mycobacterium florentinum]
MNRIADIGVEAVNVTVLHVRRIVAALCTALGRTKREVSDLAWDYGELAGRVRWSARRTTSDQHVAEVISIDLGRRRAN